MQHERKFTLTVARLDPLRRNVPSEIPEQRVAEYHSIIDDLQDSIAEDLSSFRIPPDEVKPRVASVRMAAFGPGSGGVTYTKTKYCDQNLFIRQLEALSNYIHSVKSSTSLKPDSNDYWSMTDEELGRLADRYHIPPASSSPDGRWYIDRVRIIDQLLKRDRVLSPTSTLQQNRIEIGTMIGSSIQQGTSNSVATVDFRTADPEIRTLLDEIRNSLEELHATSSARNELITDIETVELQLNSSHPKSSIVLESLHSIRNIVEGATGSIAATTLLPYLEKVLRHFA